MLLLEILYFSTKPCKFLLILHICFFAWFDRFDFGLELVYIFLARFAFRSKNGFSILVIDFESVELRLFYFIGCFKQIVFLFTRVYSKQKLAISLLLCHEFGYKFSHIWISSWCSNFVESILDVSEICHFLLHLFLEEGRPQSLDPQVLPFFDFVLVFTFACCHLCNFLLAFHTLHSFL